MLNETEIPALAAELAKAVEIIMDPLTPHTTRTEAYGACESFKETSPLCARTGLFMASGNYSNNVKHFGLHLMENTVKFKWNDISQDEKLFIKENAMNLVIMGVGPAEDQNLSHIKDALSRVIVEMIKREWPQQWSSLLSELSAASSKGEAQTELVVLIFLRLIEDVALLQTIESNQRRRDIYQALTIKMTEIFAFFLTLIEMHVTSFRRTIALGDVQKSSSHSRVVEVVLLTLTGFVEWVSISHIMCDGGKLLHLLCILLNDLAFQINAAECLSNIVNRKGQLKERKPLCALFSKETIDHVFHAIQTLPQGVTIEKNHAFLKIISQVLSGLAQQLAALWGKEDGISKSPENFDTYLKCVFSLTQHPSLVISHGGVLIWSILFKHDLISKESIILEYIPKVIKVIGPKVIKVPYPQKISNEFLTAQSYILLDYDCESEFNNFSYRCRTSYLEIFRQSTLLVPLTTFEFCEHWLNILLSKSQIEINSSNCSANDPVYLEWEALVAVLDNVLSRILFARDRPSVQSGLILLEKCLKLETTNPLIFSELLSCVSALFVFLNMTGIGVVMHCNHVLHQVLDKIFKALTFEINDNLSPTANTLHACKSLRRHSASLMVKLGYKYPLLLLPLFDELNMQLKNLTVHSQKISKLEEITLQEALLLISNNFCDYERQTNYVAEVLNYAKEQWLALSSIFESPIRFLQFVGLNKPATQTAETDTCKINRSQMIYILYIVLGVIKRCSYPDDPDKASRGGFVVDFTETGNPICRNPATQHVLPILPQILSLVKALNGLYNSESLSALSFDFKHIHTMSESEKKNLMNMSPSISEETQVIPNKCTVLDKMQRFLTLIYEGCYHMIGSIGPSFGRDLYQMPGISQALINSVFSNLENVPDFRLRPIVRVFLKSFIHSCPPAYYSQVLLPIFSCFAPFMFCRLSTRWQYITALYEVGELNEETNDTQEVLEDMLNRALTRDYLDVLKISLLGCQIVHDSSDVTMEQDDYSRDELSYQGRVSQSPLNVEVLSDLGAKLMLHPNTSYQIFMTLLSSFSWNDGASNLKVVNLFLPVVRYMVLENIMNEHFAKNSLIAVLQGLQIHGRHDINQTSLITLGVQVYETLRAKFPCIVDVMQQIPCANVTDIQKFDEKIVTITTKGNKVDRAKKDLFRKITAQLINKNLNQMFRKEVQIASLPRVQFPSRSEEYVGESEDHNLATLFCQT